MLYCLGYHSKKYNTKIIIYFHQLYANKSKQYYKEIMVKNFHIMYFGTLQYITNFCNFALPEQYAQPLMEIEILDSNISIT